MGCSRTTPGFHPPTPAMGRQPVPTLSPTRSLSWRVRGAVAARPGEAWEGGGAHLNHPTGVGGGPPRIVPRPSRWLEDLSRPSVPLGNAARWLRGVWQLWGAAPCAHVRRPVGRPSALKCEGAPGEISGAFCGPICWSHLYCGVASLKQGQEMAREAICSELDDPNFL